ncbi:MAG: DUF4982 domain-containing protein [Bacilli bacterium]|jgi:beta-galactosidase|nr:DUF4982 domain-containing protein [Bacilli bacterium]
MKRIDLDRGWLYNPGPEFPFSFVMGEKGEEVNLPHDMGISYDVTPEGVKSSGFYKGRMGRYTKYLDVLPEWEDKDVILSVDGAYKDAEININGNLAMIHHYGYAPFTASLTKYLKEGEKNRLMIFVNNSSQYDGRWYTGSGLNRHVQLLIGEKVHLSAYPIYAVTERVEDGAAYLNVSAEIENHTAEESLMGCKILLYKDGEEKASGYFKTVIPPLGQRGGFVRLEVANPAIWDVDHPELYTIKAVLDNNDEDETVFGIRTITIDRRNGLKLNGKKIKIKGGCVHCGAGILGGVESYDSWYYRLKQHKDNGFNAIRASHNPFSKDFILACDRLGLLVLDEAFDMWNMRQGDFASDYHKDFADHWKEDLTAFIKRDRSHPSVFMWSVGNEIPERNGVSSGYEVGAELVEYVRLLDPTRPVNSSLPVTFNGLDDFQTKRMMGAWFEDMKKGFKANPEGLVVSLDNSYSMEIYGPLNEPFASQLDVCGYNYVDYRYEKDGKDYPTRIICGTESYPRDFYNIWKRVNEFAYVIGDFTWTSQDYIGEAGLGISAYLSEEEAKKLPPMRGIPVEYPWRTAFCGDFDLCSEKTLQLNYRKVVWGDKNTYIYVHNPANIGKVEVLATYGWPEEYHYWTFKGYEGKKIIVDVFSNGEEVELLINGISQGKVKPSRDIARFEVTYLAGNVEAISYKNGKKISQDKIETIGTKRFIRLASNVSSLKSDGQSLAFIKAEIVDEKGRAVLLEDLKAQASFEGQGKLLAFGNGRPKTAENYTKMEFTSYLGYWQLIVRAGYEKGMAKVTIKAEGLEEESLTLPII